MEWTVIWMDKQHTTMHTHARSHTHKAWEGSSTFQKGVNEGAVLASHHCYIKAICLMGHRSGMADYNNKVYLDALNVA